MPYREIMAVCFEIHTKHINILCGQNIELLNVNLYPTGALARVRHLNACGTNAPAPKRCNHLNAQYTHVEA
jgi:hypothetical protein